MAKAPPPAQETNDIEVATPERPPCGIVRPIADMEPYPSGHWGEVHDILADAIDAAGYRPRLVSDSEGIGVILGNIVTNLYSDPIVICDVSGRNPNVMFELGMRIAFEKPTVIITDDITPFSFDISVIKHLIYPHSLRFGDIIRFKKELAGVISATVASGEDQNSRGYLQQFGPIEATELGSRTISGEQIVEDIQEIKRALRAIEFRTPPIKPNSTAKSGSQAGHYVNIVGISEDLRKGFIEELEALDTVASTEIPERLGGRALCISPTRTRAEMMKQILPIRDKYGLAQYDPSRNS